MLNSNVLTGMNPNALRKHKEERT